MNFQSAYAWCLVLPVGILCAGCQPAEETAILPQEAQVTKVDSASLAASKPPQQTQKSGEASEASASTVSTPPKIPATTIVQRAATVPFTPPFPDRLELFEPPKRTQSTVRRDDEYGESVELIGFVKVDEPRVVLSIDGVIVPIPAGGEKYGVHVHSIQPPSAVLQRGRAPWTATLD